MAAASASTSSTSELAISPGNASPAVSGRAASLSDLGLGLVPVPLWIATALAFPDLVTRIE
jgi:hypothetical protein